MKKTTSPYAIVRQSDIHHKGVFAKKDIPKGTRIIEYVGEKITKAEADKRADVVLEKSKTSVTTGAVYIFELNKRHDIDGNVKWNTARFINHTCEPNCEADNIGGHIWIIAIKNIKKGDELSYNYGYDFEEYYDHPCKCGSPYCVGYILAREHWKKLKNKKTKKKKKKT